MSQEALRRRTRRDVAAEATRREILGAARRLFARNGFAATSIQQIADEAGVAVQTIYSSVGPKSKLVVALADLIDEEADVATLGRALGETDDPRELIARAVHLTRQVYERCGDIISVALSAARDDPDAAAVLGEGLRRHTDGTARAAMRLASMGALVPGTDGEQAGAVLSMMTSPASWEALVGASGWSYDEGEEWLTASLQTLLLRA